MKPRKWVIVACLIAAAIGLASYQGTALLRRNLKLEELLSEHISPAIGGEFDVERVRFGLFSVYLRNVKVSLPAATYEIDIEDIKVGFSLRRLVTTRGDLGRSINKIIFVRPRITFHFLPYAAEPASLPSAETPQFSPQDFPVDYLLVDNGTARIAEPGGEQVLLGEKLDGRIWEEAEGLRFELRGKLASRKRNLGLTGVITGPGERNRISLRFDKARVGKPLRFPVGSILGGTLDGVCELSFSDTTSPEDFRAEGWVKITGAKAQVGVLPQPLEEFTATVSMNGSVWRLDTLHGLWNGAALRGRGAWDIAGRTESGLTFYAERIDIARMWPQAPSLVEDQFYGMGWLALRLGQGRGADSILTELDGGGFSLLGKPLTALSGRGALSSHGVRFDSVRVCTDAMNLNLSGEMAMEDSLPVYDMAVDCRLDSVPALPDLEGIVRTSGTIRGHGTQTEIELSLSGKDIHLYGVALGDHEIGIISEGSRLRFSTIRADKDNLALSGALDNLESSHPRIDLSVQIGSVPLLVFLTGNVPLANDLEGRVRLAATVKGRLPAWKAEGRLSLNTPVLEGLAQLEAQSEGEGAEPVRWSLRGADLSAGGEEVLLGMRGRLYSDSLVVDSAGLLGGVRVTGNLGVGRFDKIDMRVVYDSISLAKVGRWFLGRGMVLDSGFVAGVTRIRGTVRNPRTTSELHLDRCWASGIGPFATNAIVTSRGSAVEVAPLVVRKGGRVILSLDTLSHDRYLQVSGEFDDLDVQMLVGELVPEDYRIYGEVSGAFTATDSGFPVAFTVRSDELGFESWNVDSVRLEGSVDRGGLRLSDITCRDGARSTLEGTGWIPWSFTTQEPHETDTLRARVRIHGDLLATLGHNLEGPINGHAKGEAIVSVVATDEGWHFEECGMHAPKGVLTLYPFLLTEAKNFSFHMTMDDSSRIHTVARGTINKRPIRIFSSHNIPQGYEPFELGPLNLGVLLAETPKGGIEIHLPGFQDLGEPLEAEFAPRPPFPAFALSGPMERLKITGTWILRSAQFTYPWLPTNELPWDFDPFPYVEWEMDLKVGNRKLTYYWDLSTKRRNLIRFVECTVDPISRVELRGRDLDKTFRILGSLRSYKGWVYFGRIFDRRFEVGVDFVPQPFPQSEGYDNMPIIWGSAEAFSDTSRFERIKVTLQLKDPETGGLAERGRIRMVPRTKDSWLGGGRGASEDSIPNFTFRVSSDFEQVAGESEREFFRETGLRLSTFSGAGELVSSFGEQYLHHYFLRRLEKRLAKRLGLDVISIETSIAANYFSRFYNRQFTEWADQWDLLALANMGVTVGRYFFHDYLFLKARGELVPVDELLIPEYSLGLEFQPVRYLLMDFNYGFYKGEAALEHNPRVNMQLRLPIAGMRNMLNF